MNRELSKYLYTIFEFLIVCLLIVFLPLAIGNYSLPVLDNFIVPSLKTLWRWSKLLFEHPTASQWVLALFTFLAVLVAIFKEHLLARWFPPKLSIVFKGDAEPWVQYQMFPWGTNGQQLTGINIRLKVENHSNVTAKNVLARVDNVSFFRTIQSIPDLKPDKIIYYHPTMLKWSGEKEYNPVDIYADSHFFLDFIYVLWIPSRIGPLKPSQYQDWYFGLNHAIRSKYSDLRWGLWVDSPEQRGLQQYFYPRTHFIVYFYLLSDGIKAKKYKIIFKWNYSCYHYTEHMFLDVELYRCYKSTANKLASSQLRL